MVKTLVGAGAPLHPRGHAETEDSLGCDKGQRTETRTSLVQSAIGRYVESPQGLLGKMGNSGLELGVSAFVSGLCFPVSKMGSVIISILLL